MTTAQAAQASTAAQAATPKTAQIDRRAIPEAALEGYWTARDRQPIRRIDWPGATPERARGSILFMPGRGDHYEKYLESLDEWHRAGWRVTAADWRGQAGSGRFGKDTTTGHIDDFSTWTADLAALWTEWTNEVPGPHVLIAHSMGGHLVMRALVDEMLTPLPDAVALSAPMLGMAGPQLPLPVLHGVAKFMTMIGDPRRPAWKGGEKPGDLPEARANLLTHDPERYADEQFWREARPEIAMGPASWGWLERAYSSWRQLEQAGAMERVTVPVLIVSTSSDKLVSHSANVRAAERLPNGQLLAFGEEAHHEILREVDEVRDRMMRGIADFLDVKAPLSDAG